MASSARTLVMENYSSSAFTAPATMKAPRFSSSVEKLRVTTVLCSDSVSPCQSRYNVVWSRSALSLLKCLPKAGHTLRKDIDWIPPNFECRTRFVKAAKQMERWDPGLARFAVIDYCSRPQWNRLSKCICFSAINETPASADRELEFFSLRKNVHDSASQVEEILASAGLEELESNVADLEQQAAQSDLWEDPSKAQMTLSHLTDSKGDLMMLQSFQSKVEDAKLIVELLEDSDVRDAGLLEEAGDIVRWLRNAVDRYEMTKLLSGKYDKKGARLTIVAGAGGTDAQWHGKRNLDVASSRMRPLVQYSSLMHTHDFYAADPPGFSLYSTLEDINLGFHGLSHACQRPHFLHFQPKVVNVTMPELVPAMGGLSFSSSQRRIVETLWQKLFSDPSQWWDHRTEKENERYPDFKHKITEESLWLNSKLNPPWVAAEVAALAPGAVQMSTFSWNARLARYVKTGQYEEAIELFQQMHLEGMDPDRFTFIPVLNACANLRALEEGKHVHMQIIHSGCEADVYVGSTLVDMYAKCGNIDDAEKVFMTMPMRNVVSWNVMILGHVRCGQGQKALEISRQMLQQGVQPDCITFVGFLNACASVAALEEGKVFHQQIVQRGFESDIFVGSSLVDMYAKCGNIEDAWRVFNQITTRDVVAWSAMIQGYAKCGQGRKALELAQEMQQGGLEPVPVTFVGMLNACASLLSLAEGRRVHEQIIQSGCESDIFVGSSLVDMYAKCGSIDDAWRVFNKMPSRDAVAWSAMIQGYVKCGQGHKAVELFWEMEDVGVKPVPVTFVGMLNACASIVALGEGRRVHERIVQSGCESNVFVGSSLVNMYAKCGSIEDAWKVFNNMPTRNVVSWNALLGGYAMHGRAKEALGLFKQMCQEGVELDMVTFVALLSACSHGGLVDEGLHYFESMSAVHGISATVEHYVCMVDLLGRAGHLYEAEDLIKTMSIATNYTLWMSLLGACRVHGNVKMGERIAERALELDPGNAAGYLLLSNIYASAGDWDSSANIQRRRLERGV